MRRFSLVILAAGLAASAPAGAVVNCAAFLNADCRKDLSMDPAEVQECISRGFDAPITCRKDEGKSAGVRVQGSSGFQYGTVQAPENPPGAMGAKPSVSMSTIQRSFGFPPWPGFPCKLPGGIDLCAAGLTPSKPVDPNDPCPARSDTSGLFGAKQPLKAGTTPLNCGGAVPLTTYELTLNKSPDQLATTEFGSFYLWLYESNGSEYKMVTPKAVQLPTILCKEKIDPVTGRAMVDTITHKTLYLRSVDLTPPIAQMITYSSTSPSLTLRLQPRDAEAMSDPATVTQWKKLKPPYNEGDPEKLLVIPIVGSSLKMPSIPKFHSVDNTTSPAENLYTDCALESDYYKEASDSKMDFSIESAVNSGCESNPTLCAGQPAEPGPDSSCDLVTVRPKGTYSSTVCDGKTQYFVLDRPNLYFPPGSEAKATAIEGRTPLLVATPKNAQVYMQSATILRVNKTAPDLVLKEGGTVVLPDKSKLAMLPSVTIKATSGTVVLTGGAKQISAGGNLIKQYGPGSTFTIPAFPLRVSVARSMDIPEGYMLPTQADPYVQLPVK